MSTEWLRADTHVHYYDCFDEQAFLDAAARNLCSRQGDSERATGILLLTETMQSNWFARLRDEGPDSGSREAGWTVADGGDAISLVLNSAARDRLVVVAGRQIVCTERIEVLALGMAEVPEDGAPIREVIKAVDAAGALPVIAWGVGKWTGARGATVKALLEKPPCQIAIGDNGGRLGILPRPALFDVADQNGITILPGTDLLPFERNAERAGTYGMEWRGTQCEGKYGKGVIDALRSGGISTTTFGRLARISDFVRDQVAIQMKKRRQ